MGIIANTTDLTTQAPNPLANPALNPPKITAANSFGYDPTLSTVNQGTDTVSGQLDQILKKDEPWVTKARADAAQEANSRGLINSSMGAQAGESAAIGAALPIASQDANTYSTQRLTNQQYGNAASQFTAGAANTGSQFNAGQANDIAKIGATTQAQTALIGAQGAETRATQAQGATQAQTLQAQSITGQKDIQTIQSNMQLGLSDKNAALQTLLQNMQSSTQMTLQEKSATQQTLITQMDVNSRAALQAAQNSATLSVADKQAAQSKYNADLASNTQIQMQGVDNAFKNTLQTADLASKATLTALDDSTKVELGNIQANYQTLMQTSASATSMFNQTMGMIQNVVADATIPVANKATLINGYLGWAKQGMNLIGNVNGVDTVDLLNFSTVSVA